MTEGLVERDCEEERIAVREAEQTPGCDTAAIGVPTEAFDPCEYVDGLEFATPAPVVESDPALVGHWSAVEGSEGYLPVHSVHRPTGNYLQLGAKDNGLSGYSFDTDEVTWFPPEVCTPLDEVNGADDCELAQDIFPGTAGVQSRRTSFLAGINLFCSAHTNVLPTSTAEITGDGPRTLVVGGADLGNVNDGLANAYPSGDLHRDASWPGTYKGASEAECRKRTMKLVKTAARSYCNLSHRREGHSRC